MLFCVKFEMDTGKIHTTYFDGFDNMRDAQEYIENLPPGHWFEAPNTSWFMLRFEKLASIYIEQMG